MKRTYIGLACTNHDPALAIVNSQGEITFAEAAERYLQTKRGASHFGESGPHPLAPYALRAGEANNYAQGTARSTALRTSLLPIREKGNRITVPLPL
ncbi:MAG: hypothetical protein ACO4AI_04930 [Prochlorothrix sp.]